MEPCEIFRKAKEEDLSLRLEKGTKQKKICEKCLMPTLSILILSKKHASMLTTNANS